MKDPRFVSQHMEEYLIQNNLLCQIGPEVECFIFDDIVFHNNNSDKHHGTEVISTEQCGIGKYPIRRKDGYDAPPFQDSLLEFRFEVAEILKNYYIKVTNLNHEVSSSGQIEINFVHNTLTKAADNVQIYKDVVRNVAKQYNKVANFMPKPIFDESNTINGVVVVIMVQVCMLISVCGASLLQVVKTYSMMTKMIMRKSAKKEDTLSAEC